MVVPRETGSTSKRLATRTAPAAWPVWLPKRCWPRAAGSSRPSGSAWPASTARGEFPRLEALRAGEPIAAPAEGYLNLVHVLDAATVVLAADERGHPPALYCVSDGHPALRRDYYECLARLAGAPPPQFTEPPADSPAAQRAEANRRVANMRLLDRTRPCNSSFLPFAKGCRPSSKTEIAESYPVNRFRLATFRFT